MRAAYGFSPGLRTIPERSSSLFRASWEIESPIVRIGGEKKTLFEVVFEQDVGIGSRDPRGVQETMCCAWSSGTKSV